jgi:hypothetical protein
MKEKKRTKYQKPRDSRIPDYCAKSPIVFNIDPPKIKMNEIFEMNQHSKSHSKKHINHMKQSMKKGKSFKQSHSLAMKAVGK